MGVTVQSQGPGGKIMTCAHRYQKRYWESYTTPGRCYVFSQDLTFDPFSNTDGGGWNFCEGRSKDHHHFGFCQQGLAATFTKDYHYVMFGAPGAYNWQGIVQVDQRNNTLVEMEIFEDGPYEVVNELNSLPANSYLGFSLDSGHRITKSRDLTVVAGAPRANHKGAVVLLKRENKLSGKLLVEHILHGSGPASSFGYDVAVVDLNGDGWEDIVVGAPHFYTKDKDIGGAVYVYINKAGLWENVSPVQLNGTKLSMFGLAVEDIGDINQDSYKDLAVGAPQDDDGAGNVYIYHGSAQGIKTSSAQILSGKAHSIRFFGYSLAGNMDLDDNSYPDLAVGSLSDSAVIYRARPVVTITKDVKVSPEEIDLSQTTCGNSFCFTVETCFSFKGNPAFYNPQLTIRYSIEADGLRLNSRVMFLNESQAESDNQFNSTIELQGQNKPKCIILTAKLKDNIKDKMRSIIIEVSAKIIGAKQQKAKHSLPDILPILDTNQPSKAVTEITFVKEGCRDGQICRSNLKMEYSLHYKESSQEFTSLPKSENNVPEFFLNYQKKDLALLVTVTNMNGDDAYEAKLVGNFPNTLSYSGVRSVTIIATGKSSDQTDLAPVKVKSKVIVELPLSISGEAKPSQVSFGGVVKGESAMKREDDIGSLINFSFTINNLWKSLEPSIKASLYIHWPKSSKDGKWLLYLVKIMSRGPGDVACSPESEINFLKLAQDSSVTRTKREIAAKERNSGSKMFFLAGKNNALSCEEENRCVVLKCPLQGFDGTAVELRSRLWNSTFIEDFASFPTVLLTVKASLVLHTQAQNLILTTPDAIVKVTVSPDSSVAQYGGVPWWIILLAVLAGVSILALMVFLLSKCGFFKRSRQDDSVPRYHAVRIKKETPLCRDGKVILDAFEKKQWMTTWMDNESYS
ncbi:integrin alpha-6 [Nematolebias whitei]|uniref:integrin alpha-6 n=1 Tax=Nematolebias whitei TaxID=451745 RepID=UPI001899F5A3|nr:integrin alpha-6 [Nematolebias whitei]